MNAYNQLEVKERCLHKKDDDILEILLKKEDWKEGMAPARYAYHVTNVPEEVLSKNAKVIQL